MNQLLNNRVGKNPKAQKRGCLFLVLGSIAALLATGAYTLGITRLTLIYIEARHGGEAAYALMGATMGSCVVVLILFYAILAIWYISPTQAEVDRQNRQMAAAPGGHNTRPAKAMPRNRLWLITGGLLLGVLLTGLVSLNTYKLVTEDGIRSYFFAETGRYEWADVSAYTVNCDMDKGLSVTFSMADGKQFEILQGTNSATNAFKEKYTSVIQFAADVDDRLMHPTDDSPVTPRNMNSIAYDRAVKFYQTPYPDVWPYVAQMIGYEDLEMSDDETAAPDTETSAENPTDTAA